MRKIILIAVFILLFIPAYFLGKYMFYKGEIQIKKISKVELVNKEYVKPEQKKILMESPGEITKDNEIIKGLIKDLENTDYKVSQDAADKLADLGGNTVVELLEALKSDSVLLKGQVVFILGRIADKEAVPALVDVLKDDSAYIRRNAAEALGKIGNEQALSALLISLFDEDGGVRERSAWALGELKNPQAAEDLLKRLTEEKEERVKSAIVKSLGEIKDQRVSAALIIELNAKNDQLYKNEIVISLGEIGDVGVIEDLTKYLDSLKKNEPEDPFLKFQWQQAINITEEAIQKIGKK